MGIPIGLSVFGLLMCYCLLIYLGPDRGQMVDLRHACVGQSGCGLGLGLALGLMELPRLPMYVHTIHAVRCLAAFLRGVILDQARFAVCNLVLVMITFHTYISVCGDRVGTRTAVAIYLAAVFWLSWLRSVTILISYIFAPTRTITTRIQTTTTQLKKSNSQNK